MDAVVGLIPVKFTGSHTLQSLNTAYCNPTYCINTLSLRVLKIYSAFLGDSHEALSSRTSCNYQGFTFTVRTTNKNNIDYIDIHANKKYQLHPYGPHRLI